MKRYLAGAAIAFFLCGAAWAAQGNESVRQTMASTISPIAAQELKPFFSGAGRPPAGPGPKTQADWDTLWAAAEKNIGPIQQKIADGLGVTSRADTLGGVPVLRVFPPNYKADSRVIIYTHGGAYVMLSARSSIATAALLSAASGLEVISVDYTVAPRGNWRTITDQVISVWKALMASGQDPAATGLFGDSAGGGLAAGSVLKMRDEGLPLPGALFLGSPWTDVTDAGDSYITLRDADPMLSVEQLDVAAKAYAAPADQHNPYVSPVYGDYSKPFPPTLIQGGTRELFLSDFVRLYQAIRGGGHEAVLDLYEGMPHVFQAFAPNSPESKTAVAREAAFFLKYLKET